MRPYELPGWTTQRWMEEAPIQWVPLSKVVFQQEVSLMELLKVFQGKPNHVGGDLPFLVRIDDEYLIEDGHHRVAKAILTQRDCIQARVLDLAAIGIGKVEAQLRSVTA